ncbi:MAG: alpha-ribazole phosphatase [Crocinitomicaceae bacterium]|nr:alpha-ribazole phosphatase [Flavobacteriales bacterium]NQZ36798.1 alpha-ribazole phosphatase [Crocinitomicaceae bacterium]
MELILIRHTTPDIDKGICYGQSDLDLAGSFESELTPILEELGMQSRVYSSPLKRCRLLADRIGTEVRLDDRLMEMDFGDWELKLWNDIPTDEIQPWYDDYVNARTNNGESLQLLDARVRSFFDELKALEDDIVVCVTHAGVIRVMNGIINELRLDQIFSLKVKYGEVLRFFI